MCLKKGDAKKQYDKFKTEMRIFLEVSNVLMFVFLISGLYFILMGYPYITNQKQIPVSHYQTFYSDKLAGYIYLELSSTDALMADNPINISIYTSTLININYLQLTFDGASKYFPIKYNFSNPKFFDTEYDSYLLSHKNIVTLSKDIKTHTKHTPFYGSITNMTYGTGGKFDIGLTIARDNGGIIGYETGQREYVIKEAIYISPLETSLSIRTNNLMYGLACIAIGISLIIPGFTILTQLIAEYRLRKKSKITKRNRFSSMFN